MKKNTLFLLIIPIFLFILGEHCTSNTTKNNEESLSVEPQTRISVQGVTQESTQIENRQTSVPTEQTDSATPSIRQYSVISLKESSFAGQPLYLISLAPVEDIDPREKQILILKQLMQLSFLDRNPSSNYYIGVGFGEEGITPVYIHNIRDVRTYLAYNMTDDDFLSKMQVCHFNHNRDFCVDIESRLGPVESSYYDEYPVQSIHYYPHKNMSRREINKEILLLFSNLISNPSLAGQQVYCIVQLHFNGQTLNYITTSNNILAFIQKEISLEDFNQTLSVQVLP